jgi:type IV secretory pathway VirB10-like protein
MFGSAAMLSLVIVHHQAGMNDAGNPAKQSQEQAQEKTQDPARHQDSNRWKKDAEKIAECFHLEIDHKQEHEC